MTRDAFSFKGMPNVSFESGINHSPSVSERVQIGMRNHVFEPGPLSDYEHAIKDFHDHIRAVCPVTTLPAAPPEGTLRAQCGDSGGVKQNRHPEVTLVISSPDYSSAGRPFRARGLEPQRHRGTEATQRRKQTTDERR